MTGPQDPSGTRKLIAAIEDRNADQRDAPHIVISSYAGSSRPTFFGPFPNAITALRVAAVEAATLRAECPGAAASFTVARLQSPALMELLSSGS